MTASSFHFIGEIRKRLERESEDPPWNSISYFPPEG
jgi:hypothetical protein